MLILKINLLLRYKSMKENFSCILVFMSINIEIDLKLFLI